MANATIAGLNASLDLMEAARTEYRSWKYYQDWSNAVIWVTCVFITLAFIPVFWHGFIAKKRWRENRELLNRLFGDREKEDKKRVKKGGDSDAQNADNKRGGASTRGAEDEVDAEAGFSENEGAPEDTNEEMVKLCKRALESSWKGNKEMIKVFKKHLLGEDEVSDNTESASPPAQRHSTSLAEMWQGLRLLGRINRGTEEVETEASGGSRDEAAKSGGQSLGRIRPLESTEAEKTKGGDIDFELLEKAFPSWATPWLINGNILLGGSSLFQGLIAFPHNLSVHMVAGYMATAASTPGERPANIVETNCFIYLRFVTVMMFVALGPGMFFEGAVLKGNFVRDCAAAERLQGAVDCYWIPKALRSGSDRPFANCTASDIAAHPSDDYYVACYTELDPDWGIYLGQLGIVYATVQLLVQVVMFALRAGVLLWSHNCAAQGIILSASKFAEERENKQGQESEDDGSEKARVKERLKEALAAFDDALSKDLSPKSEGDGRDDVKNQFCKPGEAFKAIVDARSKDLTLDAKGDAHLVEGLGSLADWGGMIQQYLEKHGIFELPSWVPARGGRSRSKDQPEINSSEPTNIRRQELLGLIDHFWFISTVMRTWSSRTKWILYAGCFIFVASYFVMLFSVNALALFLGTAFNWAVFFFTILFIVSSFLFGCAGANVELPFCFSSTLVYFCSLCAFHNLKPPTVEEFLDIQKDFAEQLEAMFDDEQLAAMFDIDVQEPAPTPSTNDRLTSGKAHQRAQKQAEEQTEATIPAYHLPLVSYRGKKKEIFLMYELDRIGEKKNGKEEEKKIGHTFPAPIKKRVSYDSSGNSVSLSSDGNIVAIGARLNDGNGLDSGHVRVYQWNPTEGWLQRGSGIDGELSSDYSGGSVSLSSDGGTIAIGATFNDHTAKSDGPTRIYKWNSSSRQWEKRGNDIEGSAANDETGIQTSDAAEYNISIRQRKTPLKYDDDTQTSHIIAFLKLYQQKKFEGKSESKRPDNSNNQERINGLLSKSESKRAGNSSSQEGIDGDSFLDDCSSLETLSLHDNVLTVLPDTFLDDCSSLVALYINDNDLTVLPDSFLDDCSSLVELYINDNDLTVLPDSFLDDCSSLVTLCLHDNVLTVLPDSFLNDCSSLVWLSLHDNDLTVLPDSFLNDCSSLVELSLYGNDLTLLPDSFLDDCSSLVTLSLRDNVLTVLPDTFLDDCSSLVTLYLYDNQLRTLPARFLSGSRALHTLLLHDNKLSEANPELFASKPLARLTLHGNLIGMFEAVAFGRNLQGFPILMPNAASCTVTEPEYAEAAGLLCVDKDPTGLFFTSKEPIPCSWVLASGTCGDADNREVCPVSCGLCSPADSSPGGQSELLPPPRLEPVGTPADTLKTLRCTECGLGFVLTRSAGSDGGAARCALPPFGPHSGWQGEVKTDFGGDLFGRVSSDSATGSTAVATLVRGDSYSTGPPELTPKDTKFVGYARGLFDKIHYELDFGPGQVDIGCGEVLSGDTSDLNLSESLEAAGTGTNTTKRSAIKNPFHPYGPELLYDSIEHRFRFRVTAADPTRGSSQPADTSGINVTFDTCLSGFPTAITVYNSADGAQVFPTVARSVLPGRGAWVVTSTKFPHERGCGVLNLGAKGTARLPPGDYIVAIEAGLSWDYRATEYFEAFERSGQYVLKMECADASEVAVLRGADEQPGGMFVDPVTGAVSGAPQHTGSYSMTVVAIDAAGSRAPIRSWEFGVTEPSQAFEVAVVPIRTHSAGREYTDPQTEPVVEGLPTFLVKEAYKIAPLQLDLQRTNVTGGTKAEITYRLDGAPPTFFVQTDTGIIFGEFPSPNIYSFKLLAVDAGGKTGVVEDMSFRAMHEDSFDPANGPNGQGCGPGNAVDDVRFDGRFACDCGDTKFEGDNCDAERPPASAASTDDEDITLSIYIGAAFGVFIIVLVTIAAFWRYRVYKISMRAFDFEEELERLKEAGELEADRTGIPREIKRDHVTMTSEIGSGAFGEVWKGLLDESSLPGGVPGYAVAIKTAKEAHGEGADELKREATIMAQVAGHPNLVALIGVVTTGVPLLLLLSLCENGSLLSYLRNCKAGDKALSPSDRLKFGIEIAHGMKHLAELHFVHRDLAARNVLVDSIFTCKVADFGLSRTTAVGSNDGNAEYYKSQHGTFPIRWTSPEAMTTLKFSAASDVWSFGITMVEIYTDGARPYPTLLNAKVIAAVNAGERCRRPALCSEAVYTLLLQCWSEAPEGRPSFHAIIQRLEQLRGELAEPQLPGEASATAADGTDGDEHDIPNYQRRVEHSAGDDDEYDMPTYQRREQHSVERHKPRAGVRAVGPDGYVHGHDSSAPIAHMAETNLDSAQATTLRTDALTVVPAGPDGYVQGHDSSAPIAHMAETNLDSAQAMADRANDDSPVAGRDASSRDDPRMTESHASDAPYHFASQGDGCLDVAGQLEDEYETTDVPRKQCHHSAFANSGINEETAHASPYAAEFALVQPMDRGGAESMLAAARVDGGFLLRKRDESKLVVSLFNGGRYSHHTLKAGSAENGYQWEEKGTPIEGESLVEVATNLLHDHHVRSPSLVSNPFSVPARHVPGNGVPSETSGPVDIVTMLAEDETRL